MVVVDECHHLPAVSSQNVVRAANVRRWLGLTATPYRRQGLEAIMTMHLGPKRLVIGNAQRDGGAPTTTRGPRDLSDPAVDDDGGIHDVYVRSSTTTSAPR